MRNLTAPMLGALILSSVALDAQTTVTPDDYTLDTAFFAESIIFQTDVNPTDGTYDNTTQLAGLNVRTVDGFGQVYDFCTEFFVGISSVSTFQVNPGLTPVANPADPTQQSIATARQATIRTLFSNTIPAFLNLYNAYLADVPSGAEDPAFQSDFDNLQGYAGGMQIALWEIVEETNSFLTVDGGDTGIFRTDFDANSGPTGDIQSDLAVNYAESFLTSIRTSAWSDQGGLDYFYADAGDDQSRIWVQIPEPSVAMLGLLGAALLLRRRV